MRTKRDSEAGRVRSEVSYPGYSLKEAVRVAEAVQKAGGNEASEDDVRQMLNLTSKTARTWTYRLSSTREFGLVDRTGRAEDAKIRVTDLYKRIALPESEAAKRAALTQALLKPPLYGRLLEKYASMPVPDADGLANLLEREYKILASMKTWAAAAFIESLQFAQVITPNNTVSLTANGHGGGNGNGEAAQSNPPPRDPARQGNGSDHAFDLPEDFIKHPFQLRKGVAIVVALPADLTKRDVDRLYKWMLTLPIEDEEGGTVAP